MLGRPIPATLVQGPGRVGRHDARSSRSFAIRPGGLVDIGI